MHMLSSSTLEAMANGVCHEERHKNRAQHEDGEALKQHYAPP